MKIGVKTNFKLHYLKRIKTAKKNTNKNKHLQKFPSK